uniref:Uncharacterized protein n=1 Tax=Romanomermis culicivorax TaxID=13658 RepID=A0A915I6J8_ROMCU
MISQRHLKMNWPWAPSMNTACGNTGLKRGRLNFEGRLVGKTTKTIRYRHLQSMTKDFDDHERLVAVVGVSVAAETAPFNSPFRITMSNSSAVVDVQLGMRAKWCRSFSKSLSNGDDEPVDVAPKNDR